MWRVVNGLDNAALDSLSLVGQFSSQQNFSFYVQPSFKLQKRSRIISTLINFTVTASWYVADPWFKKPCFDSFFIIPEWSPARNAIPKADISAEVLLSIILPVKSAINWTMKSFRDTPPSILLKLKTILLLTCDMNSNTETGRYLDPRHTIFLHTII